MQIQNTDTSLFAPAAAATTPTNPADSANANAAASAAALSSTDALGNESTFLQLLVSEIQTQDPTAPMDSTTFLTQLAQFSQLEQLIGIRQDVSQLDPATPTGSSSTTNPTTGS
jgi:flagellar basal-body rod modification protein FlgD